MLTLFVVGLAFGGGAAAAGNPVDGLSVECAMPPVPVKPPGSLPPPPEVPRIQGDTVDDPFVIYAIPFSTAGETCGFNNDYDYACPYTGSTSPDLVYSYVPTADLAVVIDLCSSTYDTKVYVYEDSVGAPIACNDDYCSWQSYLGDVPLQAGHTYYIVIDGYGGSCGAYVLDFYTYCCPQSLECPPGAMPEGEPDCYDGYVDTYNGGCNVAPFPVFQVLEPACDPIVICGTTGVYSFDSLLYRDTDWFELDLTGPADICLAGDSEIASYFFIIDGRNGCADLEIMTYAIVGPFAPVSGLCWYCDAGTWWMWSGPSAWDVNYLCGSTYWMEITGYTGGASPASETTWGRVKGLFR
jgi:hypothetical protein